MPRQFSECVGHILFQCFEHLQIGAARQPAVNIQSLSIRVKAIGLFPNREEICAHVKQALEAKAVAAVSNARGAPPPPPSLASTVASLLPLPLDLMALDH